MGALSELERRKLADLERTLAQDHELVALAELVDSITPGFRHRLRRYGYLLRPCCPFGWALLGLALLILLGGLVVLASGVSAPWIVTVELFGALPLAALGSLVQPRRRP